MFDGFAERWVSTRGARIYALVGGSGPPLLLMHGYPQNHVAWHAVAPRLVDHFSLVLPDLRGASTGPPPDPENANYSKRMMAEDMIEVMGALGHERFFLAGHDRGGRVPYRLALDHPDRVSRLAIVDILPTLDVWEQIDGQNASASYHWLLLAQPAPLPERLIGCDPEFFLQHLLDRWAGRRQALELSTVAEYSRHFRNPSVIAAACEDYRAGATIDLELDRKDGATAGVSVVRHFSCGRNGT